MSIGTIPARSSGSASLIHQASRTLTNAQIKALPTTRIAIVPATELLEYQTPPTRLILPVSAVGIKSAGVAYGNYDAATQFLLAWGSDFSTTVGAAIEMVAAQTAGFPDPPFGSFSEFALGSTDAWQITFVIAPAPFGGGGYQDNGLYLAMYNAGGALTLGDAANTLDICCAFHVYDVPLKKYLTTVESGWDQASRTFS